MSRGTTAIINFDNLRHNFDVLSEMAPGKLVLVVKADAYGHGLQQIVKALDKAECFGVATIDEALLVRKVRKNVRILLLEGYLDENELKVAIENHFDCVIHQQQQIDLLQQINCKGKKLNIWLKFDSGMNRLGFSEKEFQDAIQLMESHEAVDELILMSHLASANLRQSNFTEMQAEKFLKFHTNQQLSLSNSSALLHGNHLKDEWCRVGLALFGVSPIETTMAEDYDLKPVMRLQTNVIAVKDIKSGESVGYSQTYIAEFDMKVAIIGIGYGDGYPWSLSKSAYVKINNQKAPIVGRVSMDMMAIDISEMKDVKIGDSVLIWGDEDAASLPIEIVAENANTIPYVLLCQITSRVHYQYVNQ
ncbi:MAG TPA: alanine racemase [Gammaproteobacteria bacterium]|nr:alanine racemase [Gammaproteobacteria bacterium]